MIRTNARPFPALLAATLSLLPLQMVSAQAATGPGSNTLAPNTTLVGSSSQRLQSANGEYQLVMQGDGNLVIYGPGTALWWTGTTGGSDRSLVMQGDGNLVIYNGAGQALWNTGTQGNAGTYLAMQDDGNLVLYAPGPRAIWWTSTTATGLAPYGNLLGATSQYLTSPNRQYQLFMQGDGNLVLYGPGGARWWTSTTGGSDRTLVMQGDGNLVVYNGSGQALWNTGTQGNAGTFLALQDDGNLVLYAPGSRALWSRVTGTIASAPSGPYTFGNSAIADRAESNASGVYGGQCLAFVTNMISAAGGPVLGFGYDTSTYQSQWARIAVAIGSLAESRRGDIVQWGGGAGGSQLHTAIITVGGVNAQVIDSNWGYTERVGRGSFASRNPSGTVYRIWRLGRV